MIPIFKTILAAFQNDDTGAVLNITGAKGNATPVDTENFVLTYSLIAGRDAASGNIKPYRIGTDSADAQANIGAFIVPAMAKLYAYNGATWDRLQVDTNKQLKTTEQAYNFTNTNPAVTNASSVILAANAARKFLMIQNKDAAGNIYIVFGAAATVALGIKIAPGQTLTLDAKVPAGSINAIGDIANNPNVVVVEG